MPAFVGYTDVCVMDAALCRALAAGYPASVRMLGFFVPDSAWRAYRNGVTSGLDDYLIAQAGTRRSKEEFAALLKGLRERNGVIPDNSKLIPGIARDARIPLGVVAETPTSMTFGVVMHLQPIGARPEETQPAVALNIALLRPSTTLSLYVFRRFRDERDITVAKQQAADWIACIEAIR